MKKFLENEDAVSPVIGAILILAIGVTILTNVQLNFVPVWNTQEDLDHLNKMNDNFKELKSGIESAVQSGTILSVPVNMGFKYSPKVLINNPKESAYASFRVKEDTWAQLRYNEIFPDGISDETTIKNLTTSTISYELYGTQKYYPFIYEHGLIRRNGSNYTSSSQTSITNGRISLLSVKPPRPENTTGTTKRTVNIYPTSVQKNSVLGKNVWLILHTRPEYVNWWKESIEKEGGKVRKSDSINGTIIAYLDTMIIKMGEAYISTTSGASPPQAPAFRIIKIIPDNAYIPVDGMTNLVVEVQDRYNNPIPNIKVDFKINDSRKPANAKATATLLQNQAISGADGRSSVMLKTAGAGFYYIDASISGNVTTFVYRASSQGNVLMLDKAPSGNKYIIKANLTDSLGEHIDEEKIYFETGDGIVSPSYDETDEHGQASTTLSVSSAVGLKITNINITNTTDSSSMISWDTINKIIVSAKSGYVFNSIEVPDMVKGTGCVQYGTVSGGAYTNISCDSGSISHLITLSGLMPETAYYLKINSSNGTRSATSSEYMFVTGLLSS